LESTTTNPFHVPDDKDAVRTILFKIATRLRVVEKELVYYRKNHSSPLEDLTGTDDSPSSHGIETPPESVDKSEETTNLSNLSDELARFTIGFQKKTHFGESSNMMLVMAAIDHREGLNVTKWQSMFAKVRRPGFWHVPSVRTTKSYTIPETHDQAVLVAWEIWSRTSTTTYWF